MRSVTIDLALAAAKPRAADPAFSMLTGPIFGLAAAMWEDWVPKGWILRTWNNAHQKVADIKGWRSVTGPVSAALASAARI
eukprot:10642377-Heterocapsa_arctica.AAC.1